MRRCLKCFNHPYAKECKTVKAFATKTAVTINAVATCETSNVVYCISCKKCNIQYIGKTERELKERIGEHRGSINNDHIADFSFTVLEKIYKICKKKKKEWGAILTQKVQILILFTLFFSINTPILNKLRLSSTFCCHLGNIDHITVFNMSSENNDHL